jgi:biofilm PGA synthesis N-glycosyltransferase PgaC
MTLLYPALLILSSVYFLFLDWCRLGWLRLKRHPLSTAEPGTFVTIIIPARNEELEIEGCLIDLVQQHYPSRLLEIIIVNDNSNDNTAGVVSAFIRNHAEKVSIRLLNIDESVGNVHKKDAITLAVNAAQGKLIITTDADCRRDDEWLASMISYYEQHSPAMLCGPVAFNCNNTFFQKIQSLEFCGLVGISGGSIAMNKPLMCNGANLAFTKEIFQKINGYDSEKNIATGDDTQLMKKIADIDAGSIHFLKAKDAIVYTNAASSFKDLFNQRKRWASKIPVNMGAFTIAIAVIAWLLHLGLVITLLLSFASITPGYFFLVPFAIKVCGEILLLSGATAFFHKRRQLWLLLPAEVFYLFYIVIIGIAAPFGGYVWRGRRIGR